MDAINSARNTPLHRYVRDGGRDAVETGSDLRCSAVTADARGGGDFVGLHAYTAAEAAPLTGGTSPLAVIVVLAFAVMLLGRLGKGRGGSGKTGRRGSGGVGALLVIGLLIGATLTGTTLVRSFVHTFVTVLNHIGGLF